MSKLPRRRPSVGGRPSAFDEVTAKIRAKPGFADFLRPPPVSDLTVVGPRGNKSLPSRVSSHAASLFRESSQHKIPPICAPACCQLSDVAVTHNASSARQEPTPPEGPSRS